VVGDVDLTGTWIGYRGKIMHCVEATCSVKI
jgi:hypothetical protein